VPLYYQNTTTDFNLDGWVSDQEQIFSANSQFSIIELYNEPWIYGWAWNRPATDLQALTKKFGQMAKRVNPGCRVVSYSSTMLFTDIFEQERGSWEGLIDALADHPYVPEGTLRSNRFGSLHSNLDHGTVVRQRNPAMTHNYITEGGQWGDVWGGVDTETPSNSVEAAYKIIQYHLTIAMTGWFQSCNQIDIGTGPSGWDMPNLAFSILTYYLTDRVCVADIWPYNEMLWGGIFAQPKFITDEVRALPRAQDIDARWGVEPPDDIKQSDNMIVAVIWGHTGKSNTGYDLNGKITFENAQGLEAYKFLGEKIQPVDGVLSFQFGHTPVYITSSQLSVIELRDRIRAAKIENVTPVNMYALSLEKPADQQQTMIVRVENQMPHGIKGTLTIKPAGEAGPGGFPQGLPGGLFTIHRQGDAVAFAFGFRHRVPSLGGRDLDHPWCWKGHYYDTDYLYTMHGSTLGDMLVQHWDEASPRRWGYQTLNLPEHKKLPGSSVVINRGGTTVYECAIPRSEMPLFDPSKMSACRFSFIIINNEQAALLPRYDGKEDMQYNMQYARGYGVFDYWNKYLSSFGVSWNPMQPCQTRFAIEGGTFSEAQELPAQTPLVPSCVGPQCTGVRSVHAAAQPSTVPAAISSRESVFHRNKK
jgi:hypothetical protein